MKDQVRAGFRIGRCRIILGLGLLSLLGSWWASAAPIDLSKVERQAGPQMYFQEVFGLLYLNPSWTSESNDVLSCNDLVETFEYPSLVLPEGWVRAKIRGKEGHIPAAFLATTKATCFAQKYPKFFDRFNLSATERFYFGRLYGRYHWGNSATP